MYVFTIEAVCCGVQELNVSQNKLTTITPKLWTMTTLRVLSFDHNNLDAVPSEIENLKELKTLQLSHNQLTTIGTLNIERELLFV